MEDCRSNGVPISSKFLAGESLLREWRDSGVHLPTPVHRMQEGLKIYDEKNYDRFTTVALFSRNKLAHDFWDDALEVSDRPN